MVHNGQFEIEQYTNSVVVQSILDIRKYISVNLKYDKAPPTVHNGQFEIYRSIPDGTHRSIKNTTKQSQSNPIYSTETFHSSVQN